MLILDGLARFLHVIWIQKMDRVVCFYAIQPFNVNYYLSFSWGNPAFPEGESDRTGKIFYKFGILGAQSDE